MMVRIVLAIGVVTAIPWHATEVGRNVRSSWSTPQTVAVQGREALRTAWLQLHPTAAQRPAVPAIDFNKYRVLIVAGGNKPSGGYRLALQDARVVNDTAVISVTTFTPPPGCGVIESITAPAVAIVVPKLPAAFRIVPLVRPDTVRCT